MKWSVGISLMIAAVVAALPSTALGKGASEATITGPGLSDPVSLAGEGQPGGAALMQIAEAAGFFPAVFTQTPTRCATSARQEPSARSTPSPT